MPAPSPVPTPTPLAEVYHRAVKAYDIDARKQMTVPALVRHLQEAAMENVLRLGLSVWDLEPEQLSWVLVRKDLRLERLPGLGEDLTVLTYPSGFDRLFTFRDFRVFDADGRPVATAATTWMLMHLGTRRPVRYPAWIAERITPHLPEPAACLPRAAAQLADGHGPARGRTLQVGWHDLDFNLHLNNTYYLRWMLDALPTEVLRQNHLRELGIHYLREANLEEELRAEARAGDDGRFTHQLIKTEDGTVLAKMTSLWR